MSEKTGSSQICFTFVSTTFSSLTKGEGSISGVLEADCHGFLVCIYLSDLLANILQTFIPPAFVVVKVVAAAGKKFQAYSVSSEIIRIYS
ncbi:hypothetical protein Smp_162700 [Schistosoma mansoni]|uniref:hypothetical protein n=1 Tax=Schistosoma mansoni TaxID=6183 RepID=UPI0001A6299B|nr:hypothetical protein Smp_162700 [Schistosoma mansoni]|eukprot:XP_018650883.1 hypothetical protein Smp_162700 [Schistosoma mansoni]